MRQHCNTPPQQSYGLNVKKKHESSTALCQQTSVHSVVATAGMHIPG